MDTVQAAGGSLRTASGLLLCTPLPQACPRLRPRRVVLCEGVAAAVPVPREPSARLTTAREHLRVNGVRDTVFVSPGAHVLKLGQAA